MSPEAEVALLKGIVTLKSFQCEHKPSASCDQAEEERGGCCNSCWARRWAEEMDQLLSKGGPQPDFSKAS